MISRKIKSDRPAVSTEFPPHPGPAPHSPAASTRVPPPGSDPGRDAHGKTAHAGYRRRHHPLAVTLPHVLVPLCVSPEGRAGRCSLPSGRYA